MSVQDEITRLEDYRIHDLPGDILRANQTNPTVHRPWSNSTAYTQDNIVIYKNLQYTAKFSNTNVVPDSTKLVEYAGGMVSEGSLYWGTGRPTSGASVTPKQASNRIKSNFLAYQNVNKQLSETIRKSTPQDLGATLSQIGTLQQNIATLKSEINNAKSDLDTSEQRESQMKLSPPEISNYQGLSTKFGVTKPLKFASVPILFGLSIFLVIASILLLKENFFSGLSLGSSSTGFVPQISFMDYIKDPRIWATLFGASMIVILFLSLRIANKLPVLPA